MDANGDVVFDSLPYIDGECDIGAAQELIREELERERPEERAFDDGALFEDNPRLRLALEEAAKGSPSKGIDTNRFKLPTPSADGGDWQGAVANAKAQLEYQIDRSLNLELMSKFGANQWKIGNWQLEQLNNDMKREVDELTKTLQDINKKRKQDQVAWTAADP
ncbi:Pre-mRNA-splicing factor SPF27 [Kappamyces sp. JEL0680]|nr:Pre-mRNA-splicing factor SPF27 [Kappamyces sp. JEL0680]